MFSQYCLENLTGQVNVHIHIPSFPLHKWQCPEGKDCILSSLHFHRAFNPIPYTNQVLPKCLSTDLLTDFIRLSSVLLGGFTNSNSKHATLLKREPEQVCFSSKLKLARSSFSFLFFFFFLVGKAARVLQKNKTGRKKLQGFNVCWPLVVGEQECLEEVTILRQDQKRE